MSDALDGPFASHDPADLKGLRLARIDTTRPHPARIYDYFVDDDDDPWSLVARYRDALAPGSHLLLSHVISTAETRAATKAYETATSGLLPRSPGQITAMFDGWQLVEPGLVPIHDWRPDGGETFAGQLLGGVGRLT